MLVHDIAAAPAPITILDSRSAEYMGEMAAMMHPNNVMAIPTMNIRLLPIMSPTFARGTMKMTEDNRNIVLT